MYAPEHIERSYFEEDAPTFPRADKARMALMAAAVATLAFGGAVAPLFVASDLTRKYSVETVLRVDAAGLSKAEKLRALAEAGKAVRTAESLDAMVRTLALSRDREFAVAAPSTVGFLSEIVTGRQLSVSAADALLRNRLAQAFTATADAGGDKISISVETAQAGKSVRIAEAVATAYQRELAMSAVHSARNQATDLERAMHDADTAVSQALAKGGDQGALRRAEEERRSLAQEISTLTGTLSQVRDDAKTVAATTFADVLAKPLTSVFDYSGIDQLREGHVQAKLLVDQLSVSLGPRHPRLLAAQAALDDVRGRIETTLKSLSTSLKQQEATAATELADLKARQSKIEAAPPSAEAAALAALQTKAEKARQDYLQAVQRLDAASVSGPLTVRTAQVATAAAAKAVGVPMAMLCGIGALAGFGLGLVLAFAMRRRADADDMVEDEEEPSFETAQADVDLFDGEDVDLLAAIPEAVAEDDAIIEPRRSRIYHASASAPLYQPEDETFDEVPAVIANSDTPLADRVRELLMAHRMQAQAAEEALPPLVAAVMAKGSVTQPAYADDHKVDALRRDMASLRERVTVYSQRRAAGER